MSDPRQVAIEGEKRALRRLFLGEHGALHEDGRLAMGWLMRTGAVFARTDARNGDGAIDPLSMAYLEGGRGVVLRLMLALDLDLPDLALRLWNNEVNDDG